jgi:hypothetical protein
MTEEQKSPERIRAENFVRIYANNMQVSLSQWDMKLTFGEVLESRDSKSIPQVEDRAIVVMSLHHAKAIIDILVKNFMAFEERFGEIKLIGDPEDSSPAEENPNRESRPSR